jgi:arsenite-transporting ATPase
MTPRLHVFIGQGGVGKTTLAAGHALALARRERRVGLLGADPAGRLRDALGLAGLPERETLVPGAPGLRAALLRPGETLRRWAAAELGEGSERLARNPFFLALADHLAAATDALAGMRIAEWAEADPALDDLVVDTAPGLNGIELLGEPERLLSLLHGRLLRWLGASLGTGVVASRAAHIGDRMGRRVLRGLTRIAGQSLVSDLAGFSLLIERLALSMTARLRRANEWLREPGTEIFIVCAPTSGAVEGVRALTAGLQRISLSPTAVVVNRTLPEALLAVREPPDCDEGRAFQRFLAASARLQLSTLRQLGDGFPVLAVPFAPDLDAPGQERLLPLARLGGSLVDGLSDLGSAA